MLFTIKKFFTCTATVGILCCSTNNFANDLTISSFIRAGVAFNSGDTPYLERIDKNGNTGDTHFGLNVAKNFGQGLSAAGQIFASGVEGGGYEVLLDWAFITKRVVPSLSLSAGKIKYPNLLVSEYVDIGIAYPWARPPQELYSFDAGAHPNLSLESFTGGSATYEGFAGELEYVAQLYGGEANLDSGAVLSKMFGAKIKLSNDFYTLQAGYNRHIPENTLGEDNLPTAKNDHDTSVISVGGIVTIANVLFMTEYASGMVADNDDLDTSSYYATLGYQINKFTPHITYSTLDAEEGRNVVTIGAKYQLSNESTLKFEVQNVTPEFSDENNSDNEESFNVFSATWDMVF